MDNNYRRKDMKKILNPEGESNEREEMRDPEENGTDVLVQDYSDMEIEMLKSSRKNFLTWRGLL